MKTQALPETTAALLSPRTGSEPGPDARGNNGPGGNTSRPGQGPGRPADAAPVHRDMGRVVVLVLADLRSPAWAWLQLVRGPAALQGTPGLRFCKVLGSGAQGGFGLKPSATHRGLFLAFDEEVNARDFIARSPQLAAYRAHARECCVLMLRAYSSRGSWDGAALQLSATPPAADGGADSAVVALTRASIKLGRALPFWRLSPPAEHDLQAAPGCLLAAGLGEAPLVRQATISLWTSTAAMDAYARSGAHQAAIRQSYAGGYFSESMFVRFTPLLVQGSWQGVNHG